MTSFLPRLLPALLLLLLLAPLRLLANPIIDTNPIQRLGLGTLEATAYSPDGRFIATAGGGGVVLWDVETGEIVRQFSAPGHSVRSVAFSSDSTRILTGSYDFTAKLWDATTGAEIRTFRGHRNWVTSVAFSPDGTRVLTGSRDATAKIWNPDTGDELSTLPTHGKWVSSVAFSTDGTRVLTGSFDTSAKLWDANTGTEIRTFSGHTGEISSVAFSPDGTRVLTGSWDNTAKLWDANTGDEIRILQGHTNDVSFVAFSPDGTRILTGSWDLLAKLWDANTGAQIRTFGGFSNVLISVAFSPDGARVLTGSYDDRAKLWDSNTGAEIRTLLGHARNVTCVAFNPNGNGVLTGTDRVALLWDPGGGSVIRTFQGNTDGVSSAAFSSDGVRVLIGFDDNTAKLWDANTGAEIRTFQGNTLDFSQVALSPDGTRVLTGSGYPDTTAKLWDANTGAQIRTFQGHTQFIPSVAFFHDGTRVLTGSGDGTAKLWDADTGAEIRPFQGHTQYVVSVAFSPNGTRVLTGSYDNIAKLWDTNTGAEIHTLQRHQLPVTSVAFSPDGTRVLTGSWDHTAKLWDATTGAEIRAFQGHMDWVTSVAFSPDGTRVLTGSRDGTALIWDATTTATPSPTPSPTGSPTPTITPTPSPSPSPSPTPAPQGEAPSAPTGLRLAPGVGSILLTWNPNPEADVVGYQVYRRTGSSGNFVHLVAGEFGLLATSTLDSAVQAGVSYTYFVTAIRRGPNGPLESSPADSPRATAQAGTLRALLTGGRAAPGGKVTVRVGLENANLNLQTNANSLNVVLTYPADLLEAPVVQRAPLTQDFNLRIDGDASQPGTVRVLGEPGSGSLTGYGTLFAVEFTVPTNAAPGSRGTVSFSQFNLRDGNGQLLPLDVALTATVEVGSDFIAGDVNGDGRVDLTDATLAAEQVVGAEVAADAQAQAGDLNREQRLRVLDAADVTLIQRLAAGLDIYNPPATTKSQDFLNTRAFVDMLGARCTTLGGEKLLSVPLVVGGARAVANLQATLLWNSEELEFQNAVVKGDLEARGYLLQVKSNVGRLDVVFAGAERLGSEAEEVATLQFLVRSARVSTFTVAVGAAEVGGEYSQRPPSNPYQNRGARLKACDAEPADWLLGKATELRAEDPNFDKIRDAADLLWLRPAAFP